MAKKSYKMLYSPEEAAHGAAIAKAFEFHGFVDHKGYAAGHKPRRSLPHPPSYYYDDLYTEPEDEDLDYNDKRAIRFDRRINPYLSGLEMYACEGISEAFVEAHKRKEWMSRSGPSILGVPTKRHMAPYEEMKKDLKKFMQKRCSEQLEDLEKMMDAGKL